MKTNRSYTVVRNLVLALAGVFAVSGLASAQNVAGKFTLPFEARWGVATLPAGDYQFTMERVTSPAMIKVTRRNKGVALILSPDRSPLSTGRSALTVVRTRSGNTVRELALPEEGMALLCLPKISFEQQSLNLPSAVVNLAALCLPRFFFPRLPLSGLRFALGQRCKSRFWLSDTN